MGYKKISHRVGLGLAVMTGVGLVLSGCNTVPATTSTRQSPDLSDATGRLQRIAILPPEVGQLRVTASGEYELVPERERTIGSQLTSTLKTALESRSYVVAVEPEAWPGDEIKPESPETKQFRSACAAILADIGDHNVSLEESTQFHASVGPVAKAVAEQRQADAILIARYTGEEKSGGRQAVEIAGQILINGLTRSNYGGHISKSSGTIALVLVDGKTGNVLWADRAAGSTDAHRGAFGKNYGFAGPAGLAQRAVSSLPARTGGRVDSGSK